MMRRTPYLFFSLGALLLASCGQITPPTSSSTTVQALSHDTYTIDAENATMLDGRLYGVRVGEGMSGPAHEGRVSVGGKRLINGAFREGQAAKVVDVWGGNRIGVVNKNSKALLNPGGGQLQFVFNPFFGKERVTVKELTIYNVIKPGAKVNLYNGRTLIRSISVPTGGAGKPVTLTINEPGISIVSVNARFPVAVDDLVVEVPREQEDFVGKEIVGNWEGSADQAGFGSYSVDLTIMKNPDADEVSAKVTYPSLDCGGTWTLKTVEGKKFTFTEQITYGTSSCVVTSDVSVTHNEDDTLTYDWRYYGSSATGPLYRAKVK